jgi:hypothetical protein
MCLGLCALSRQRCCWRLYPSFFALEQQEEEEEEEEGGGGRLSIALSMTSVTAFMS